MAIEKIGPKLRGLSHLALVSGDMARTVEFYQGVLGMPLVKTMDVPGGGQHFFFDIGNGDCLAFFWFPEAPEAAPGVASAGRLPGQGSIVSAHGSMNHIAFNVPLEKFDEYYDRLKAKGVEVSMIMNHDDSPFQVSRDLHDGVFVRSVYFFDPDGVCLEFAAWTKTFDETDVAHDPMSAEGTRVRGVVVGESAKHDEAVLATAK